MSGWERERERTTGCNVDYIINNLSYSFSSIVQTQYHNIVLLFSKEILPQALKEGEHFQCSEM